MTARSRRHGLARQTRLQLEALEDRTVPTLLGNSLFPADNPWNQKITGAPVAASSTAIMNSIISTYGDGRLHPDFGQDYGTATALYGIPYNVVHGNSTPKVHVVIDAYAGESDLQNAPVPANAVIEGDNQNGPNVGLANRGDSHLLVYDVDNNTAYEFYAASRPSENSDGQWHADQESVWDMKTNSFRTLGWTSADAAGLPILPGLARPDEGLPVSQGGQGVINHAIRVTLQNSVILDQFLYPASHVANPGNTNAAVQPPMGARLRLKASVDISQLNPQARVIAQAMKDYGLIVADNGSNFFFSGASYAVDANNQRTLTWNDNDIQDTLHGLKSLHFSDFEVADLTPRVTGLSAAGGPAGTAVTVVGQNFTGAAGHLQVFFGSVPAASVTVVDDSHVVALAPAGSGTVDVRVVSGVGTAFDSQNLLGTLFGNGTSAVNAADQFTYGSSVTGPSGNGSSSSGSSTSQTGTGSTTTGSTGTSTGSGVAAGSVHAPSTVGVVDPGSSWYLKSTNGAGAPDLRPFAYGGGGWIPVAGDWNGDGRTTVGVFDPATGLWYLRNHNLPGTPDQAPFAYGAAGWIPVAGDWTGRGGTGIGVFDPNTATWYLKSSAGAGAPDLAPFRYGAPGWIPVVGDWNGDGKWTIGVVDPSTGTWYLRNSNSAGAPDIAPFRYGAAGWVPVVGDWDGNGTTTVGMFDPTRAVWYLRNSNAAGAPTVATFAYGGAGWRPVAGVWTLGGLPELAAGGEGSSDIGATLDTAGLSAIRQAALVRLAGAGVSPALLATLATVQLQVAALPPGYLGLAFPDSDRVVLDATAAGYGWFVDPTPLQDEEFAADGSALTSSPASGRMDLLTVVLHELGHVAGLGDDAGGDVMGGVLGAGVRRAGDLAAEFGRPG